MKQLDLFGYVPPEHTPAKKTKPTRPKQNDTLIDLIVGGNTVQLLRTNHKQKMHGAELKLSVKIDSLLYCEITEFQKHLKKWLNDTPMRNGHNYWLFYKLVSLVDSIQVWHTNSQGDPDRHVCTVTPL